MNPFVLLFFVTLALQLWALVDCATRREALFPAAGKLTKGAWLAICAGALVADLVPFIGYVAVVPSIVYLVDVRPALQEVGGG